MNKIVKYSLSADFVTAECRSSPVRFGRHLPAKVLSDALASRVAGPISLSLIRVFVIEFIEQYTWFGLSSTVHIVVCSLCVLLVYIFSYVLCSALYNLAQFYATVLINSLTYLTI